MPQKLFTKSAFKQALQCPASAYYYRNPQLYANQQLDDEFLESLAEGGFQVGEAAKVYYGIPDATLYDFPTYRMDHVFSTKDATQYWLRNLHIGFRFTVLFGFPGKERCIICDPWRH